MTINYQVLEEYVNKLVVNHIPEAEIVSVIKDDTLLPKATGSSIIHISNQSITLLLLYACFAKDNKLFKRLLFYYYWTCRNLSELKIQTAAHCFQKMFETIKDKGDRMYGYAQSVQYNLLCFFVLGHEACHTCFSQNESFKQSSIDDAMLFLNDVFKDTSDLNNKIVEKITKQVMAEINGNRFSDEKEEYACDRLSIRFLMNKGLAGVEISEDQYKDISQQLLDMTMMLQYDNNMQRLREGVFKWSSYKTYMSGHLRLSVFRIANVAYTLQEVLEERNVDISPLLRESILKGQKSLSGLRTFNLLDLGGAIGTDEDICEDFDKIAFMKEHLNQISDYINSLLLGEDLSIYENME